MKIKIILSTLALAVAAMAQSKLQLKVHHRGGVTGNVPKLKTVSTSQ